MDMEFFINNCEDELYVGILLYQCDYAIGEKLTNLSNGNKLIDTFIIGLLKPYNNKLINKLGAKKYLLLIDKINEYYGGKKSNQLIIKKNWMSEKNRKLLFN